MYVELAEFLKNWKRNDYEIMIYAATGNEHLERIVSGYIFEVTAEYIALGQEKDHYTNVVLMDKIVRIEIIDTPEDKDKTALKK